MDGSEEILIKVDRLVKVFKLPHEKQSSLKSLVINLYRSSRKYELQKALNNVSFEIKKGEFFGIVGRNGSGKSTLLKLLAGIYIPTTGTVHVRGKLTPFIELGVGFNPELTGRENVYLNGALLGFNRKEMDAMYQDIVAFAELKRFMDQKLKNYSSGMQVRLAFSIAIRAESDILLIDEVLAVGDAVFQKKCYDYFKELKKKGKTVVFISHDTAALQEYCDRGILMNKGKVIKEGNIREVVRDYIDLLNKEEQDNIAGGEVKAASKRWGTHEIEVTNAEVLGQDGNERKVFDDKDKKIKIRVTYKAKTECEDPVYGITIYDGEGKNIFQSNTMWAKEKTAPVKPGSKIQVEWEVPNIFNTGSFNVSPAVADRAGSVIYDWQEEMVGFKVRKELQSTAFVNVDHGLKVTHN